MKAARLALLLATLAFAGAATAQSSHAHHPPAAAPAAARATALSDGEVRKVDKAGKKVMLKHGEIASIGMGPMTMVFDVKDPAALDKLKVGDKVKFRAEEIGGAYVVTRIEPAK